MKWPVRVMYEFIKDNSVYIAVLAGLIIGTPLIMPLEKADTKKGRWRAVPHAAVFSVVSVVSVLLFASFEKVISGEGFSIGAVSTYGVYLIAPIFLLLIFRQDRALRFDQFAIYALPSLFLQRVRCLFTGCCYGKLMAGSELRWPVRESELVFYAVLLIVLIYMYNCGKLKSGTLFPVLMISYGTFRFLNEFFRDNGAGLFHMAHMWSIITLIIGVCLYIELSPNEGNNNLKSKKRGKR